MNKTKQNILNASRHLFNDLGYSQVTIRMIALKLNMSSGNLNYHYRKREDILEALYFEMVGEFDARVVSLPHHPLSFEKIQQDIQSSMARMLEYRFFWTDLYNLLLQNEKIRLHFEQAYKERVKGYKYVFETLKKGKLLQEFSFPSEAEFLIERMIGYSNTWIYLSGLYESSQLTKADIASPSHQLMSMLYPYLTDLGKRAFRNAVPELF